MDVQLRVPITHQGVRSAGRLLTSTQWLRILPWNYIEIPILPLIYIEQWTDSESGAERRDVINGLLHANHLNAYLDSGFMTHGDVGHVVLARALDAADCTALGFDSPLHVATTTDSRRGYQSWRRVRMFLGLRGVA